jgi:hypothetical protein
MSRTRRRGGAPTSGTFGIAKKQAVRDGQPRLISQQEENQTDVRRLVGQRTLSTRHPGTSRLVASSPQFPASMGTSGRMKTGQAGNLHASANDGARTPPGRLPGQVIR